MRLTKRDIAYIDGAVLERQTATVEGEDCGESACSDHELVLSKVSRTCTLGRMRRGRTRLSQEAGWVAHPLPGRGGSSPVLTGRSMSFRRPCGAMAATKVRSGSRNAVPVPARTRPDRPVRRTRLFFRFCVSRPGSPLRPPSQKRCVYLARAAPIGHAVTSYPYAAGNEGLTKAFRVDCTPR